MTENTISAVKNVASDPLGAIKAGLQFIADFIQVAIVASFAFMLRAFLKAISEIIKLVTTNVGISQTSDGVSIGSSEISVYNEGKELIIDFEDTKLILSDIFFGPELGIETLAVDSSAITLPIAMVQFITTVFLTKAAESSASTSDPRFLTPAFAGPLAAIILNLWAIEEITNENDPDYDSRVKLRDDLQLFSEISLIWTILGLFTAMLVPQGKMKADKFVGLLLKRTIFPLLIGMTMFANAIDSIMNQDYSVGLGALITGASVFYSIGAGIEFTEAVPRRTKVYHAESILSIKDTVIINSIWLVIYLLMSLYYKNLNVPEYQL